MLSDDTLKRILHKSKLNHGLSGWHGYEKTELSKNEVFEKLDQFDFSYIEQYVRKKKLDNINGGNSK